VPHIAQLIEPATFRASANVPTARGRAVRGLRVAVDHARAASDGCTGGWRQYLGDMDLGTGSINGIRGRARRGSTNASNRDQGGCRDPDSEQHKEAQIAPDLKFFLSLA
jgi:hypothetical protein